MSSKKNNDKTGIVTLTSFCCNPPSVVVLIFIAVLPYQELDSQNPPVKSLTIHTPQQPWGLSQPQNTTTYMFIEFHQTHNKNNEKTI